MVGGILIEDAPVLIPNKDHQNFTATSEIIKKGTEVSGNPKLINGLRRGEPFQYKLFLTTDNKLIHLKKIKTMGNNTEVKLGADSSTTPTVVNLKQSMLAKTDIAYAIGGAALLFGYAKLYKKHEMRKSLIFAAIGAVAGFVVGKVIAHTATIKKSK